MSTPKGISHEELRASSEQREERDFKYNTNQDIQTLNKRLEALSQQQEKILARTDSERKYLSIKFENLEGQVLLGLKEMKQRLGEVETKLTNSIKAFNDFCAVVERNYLQMEAYAIDAIDKDKKVQSLDNQLASMANQFKFSIDSIRNQITTQIAAVKEDLSPIVPKIDPVKAQIEDRMKVVKVDFDGIKKEIAVLKNSIAYGEKKFENVYMLMDRLKARLQ